MADTVSPPPGTARPDILLLDAGHFDSLMTQAAGQGPVINRKGANLKAYSDLQAQVQALGSDITRIASYAAMRLYSGSATTFFIDGRTSAGDGAHGVFYYDPSDTTSADNDGTVLVGSGGKRYKRKYTGPLIPNWFGAVGDGVAIDKSALAAMFAVSKWVRLSGRYNLGTLAANEIVFNLNATGGSVLIETVGTVEFLCASNASGIAKILYVENCNGVVMGDLKLTDTAAGRGASSGSSNGSALVYVWGQTYATTGLDIYSLETVNAVAPIIVAGYTAPAGPRVRGIRIGRQKCVNTYYGSNFQNQGDGFRIGLCDFTGGLRAYFAYGCIDHDVAIQEYDGLATSGSINISCDGVRDTKNIRVKYLSRNSASGTLVLLNQVGPTFGTVSGVRLDIDCPMTVSNGNAVAFRVYASSGGAEVTSSSAVFDDIQIDGSSSGPGAHLSVATTLTTLTGGRKPLSIGPGILQSAVQAAVFGIWRVNGGGPKPQGAYLPRVEGTLTAGAATYAGGGQLGRYYTSGDLCYFSVHLQYTAHTGTGNITLTNALPFASQDDGMVNTFAILMNGIPFTSGSMIAANNAANSQTINPTQMSAAGALSLIPLPTSGTIDVSGVYRIKDNNL